MRCLISSLVLCASVVCATPELFSQQSIPSPRDSVFLSLDTNVISINYGRPSMRGRKIMGGLVPWNQVWRTGANQATHLKTSFDMTFGGVPVTRGTYTLWTLPSPDGWKVILNKQTGQWGTVYNPSLDLARFDATVEQSSPAVEKFTIALKATGKTSGVMSLMWENTTVSVPFQKNDHVRPLSPGDSTEITLAGKKATIRYSRPFARGRAIWGVVVPFDSVWRTGANLATSLVTEGEITIGTHAVPPGAYTLYSIPSAGGLTLIISRKPGGREPAYDRGSDLARITMKAERAATPIDPFRIWFEPDGTSGGTLNIGWADRSFSAKVGAH
ncbi:MAG TPA: DUF2911 domain-containing protein [Bacteroidota bacterium]|nr:DUF2911 domain-containing protein [Bacteroidota bacterium]